ncbi:Putative transposon related peptidoglycan linked protein [Streptococcus anginosus]|uniref:hypothetical protein n=1 Tax=Streptococcus anginosus TaxID=1328 RepID=UPI0010CAB2A9|nr:hypothetical protein [Streptococcus anginosus]VTS44491.1 Putative transposon related peptidoglycan linked protein [Streptococcus anginosus]
MSNISGSIGSRTLGKLAAQKAAIEQAGGQVVPVVDETGKITSYVDGKKQAVPPALTPTNYKQVKVNYNVSTNHLPSTGETTSYWDCLEESFF